MEMNRLATKTATTKVKRQKKNAKKNKRLTPEQYYLNAIISKTGSKRSAIAAKLGISKSTFSRLLSGKIKQTNNALFSRLIAYYCAVCC